MFNKVGASRICRTPIFLIRSRNLKLMPLSVSPPYFFFLQYHPLSLCNTSEDERQDSDFITIVKLEHRVRRCLPLLEKVQFHTDTHRRFDMLHAFFFFFPSWILCLPPPLPPLFPPPLSMTPSPPRYGSRQINYLATSYFPRAPLPLLDLDFKDYKYLAGASCFVRDVDLSE